MKEKDQRNYRKFSRQFILTVLLDYYSSGSSKRSIVRKYGLSGGLLYGWLRKYESESLSLPTDMSELESKVYMAQKKHKSERPAAVRPLHGRGTPARGDSPPAQGAGLFGVAQRGS